MCIINGRVEGKNDFTYVTTKGKSVVDYCLTFVDQLQYIQSCNVFRVTEMLESMSYIPDCSIPDHSVISVKLELSDFSIEMGLKHVNVSSYGRPTVNINMSNQFPDFKRFRFDHIPNDFMTGAQCVTDARYLTDKCLTLIPTQTSIDELYKTFVTMHESEMNQRFKKSFPNGHKNASKHKHPPFWDEQLKSLFKEAKHAENSFCKSLANSTERQILRKEFKTKQDKFDKSFRKIKRSYIRQKEIRIESMISKNGRGMK